VTGFKISAVKGKKKPMKSIFYNRIMLGALMFGVTAFAATTVNYHLANTYKFGAAPGDREYFDYITFDPDSRRLYLSHGSEVLVVNADTGEEEGKISGLKQSHGVAVVPEVGRGFISDGAQGKAIIFDLKTLKVVGEAKAAPDADCIIYDPASKHVFTSKGMPSCSSSRPRENRRGRCIHVLCKKFLALGLRFP
jgi:hypothetical protein